VDFLWGTGYGTGTYLGTVPVFYKICLNFIPTGLFQSLEPLYFGDGGIDDAEVIELNIGNMQLSTVTAVMWFLLKFEQEEDQKNIDPGGRKTKKGTVPTFLPKYHKYWYCSWDFLKVLMGTVSAL